MTAAFLEAEAGTIAALRWAGKMPTALLTKCGLNLASGLCTMTLATPFAADPTAALLTERGTPEAPGIIPIAVTHSLVFAFVSPGGKSDSEVQDNVLRR